MPQLESMKMSQLVIPDVKWKEEDPVIKINDENVTISQMPAAALGLGYTQPLLTNVIPWIKY